MTALTPRKLHRRKLPNGAVLDGEVSPCVLMYPGYPLQVTVTLKSGDGLTGGTVHPVNKTLNAYTATDDDVKELLNTVRVVSCKRCASPAFDPESVETNRNGLCEACFTADLQVELDRELEIERLQLIERDLRMKAKGMLCRVTAWIHPADGDDDQVDWYFPVRPTTKQIRALLRKEGSEILDDFEIIRL